MPQDSLLLDIAIQQARHIVLMLETLAQQQRSSVVCLHPEEKVVTLGTMGHFTKMCTVCQQEISTEKEAAS